MIDPLAQHLGIPAWSWEWQAALRLALACVLGAAIGMEREHRGRSAGVRTLLLVSLGAALAMVLSVQFAHFYGGSPTDAVRVDPTRVLYGVMVGVGFLGAGVIIHRGQGVRGLTTAASLWCTAAIGVACGSGAFTIALAATGLVLFALLGLIPLDRLIPTERIKFVSLTLPLAEPGAAVRLEDWLRSRGARVLDVQVGQDLAANRETITFEISLPPRVKSITMLDIAKKAPGATHVSIR
jgi:putative Mg2+ transporter-C (MgtC) family protein